MEENPSIPAELLQLMVRLHGVFSSLLTSASPTIHPTI